MSTLVRTSRKRDGVLSADLVREPGGFGLGQVPARLKPDATTSMVCGFCSTGCSLDVHLRDGVPVNLTPTTDYPVNRGMACPKGWEALTPLGAPDRATTPLWRDARGRLQSIGWEVAVNTFVERFGEILDAHGPGSVAFLSTGQIPTEEMALLGALAKFGMGMVHGDGNTRQCMATAAVAYKQSFGFDAPPYTYADFEESDVIVLVGSNLCIAHPIMWERICRNPHRPEVVVIDPRATETALAATRHIALAPKSDLVLAYGVAQVLVSRGWVERGFVDAHTTGFDAFAAHVAAFTPERVSRATGLSAAVVEGLAETIHAGRRVSFWWTMGVNQSHDGTRAAQAIVNLALMTGNIGRPGTGANSITGQCNAMGSRLFSNTTNLFGGRDFTSRADREAVASVLGIDVGRIPDRPSLAYDQIVEGVSAGRIKGLWVIATNSAHSWIDQGHLREALGRLDFLVVQDMYSSTDSGMRRGKKRAAEMGYDHFIHGMNEIQVGEREHLAPAELVRRWSEMWPKALRGRNWFPPFMRPLPVQFGPPIGRKPMGSYLMDRVFTRDTWMHRIDVCRAAGLEPVLTPDHDGRLIEDMVAEWSRVHGIAFTLRLEGPAGGMFLSGNSGDELSIDAVEWIWVLSGRGTGTGLLDKELPL